MHDLASPTALFVADSHFHLEPDAAERQRVDRFLELLELATRADHLFLLGDIFDFWFDYPHFRLKGYEAILAGLDRVRDSGTQLHFVGGNHDIWAAGYLAERYGCRRDGGPLTVTLGGLRIRLSHGDGLLAFDWVYNSFRALVRNRLGIVLAKSLHPELLFAFSTWLSGRSRAADRDEAAGIERKARRWLDSRVAPDWDLMVLGHLHHRFDLTRDGRRLVGLAGWFETLGYGLLQDGAFQQLDFARDPLPRL